MYQQTSRQKHWRERRGNSSMRPIMGMNGNRNFDRLFKIGKLAEAREMLAAWEKSRSLPNLTAAEAEFLERSIAASKANVAAWERAVKEWWT